MNLDDLNLSSAELNEKTDDYLLELVDHEPTIFPKIPEHRRDITFCIRAVTLNPYLIRYVSDPTEIMIDTALKNYPRAMLFIPKGKLTTSRCVKACRSEPMLLNAVPNEILHKVKIRLEFPILSYLIPYFILRRFMK